MLRQTYQRDHIASTMLADEVFDIFLLLNYARNLAEKQSASIPPSTRWANRHCNIEIQHSDKLRR